MRWERCGGGRELEEMEMRLRRVGVVFNAVS
jgi:hypothetical protein